ncbi:uncharacterized protein BX664DRAFT_330963 [Halteromyces radiatus]|uniref:uncharacterized protein n=1 Tax=Halteromyces radiatus TaxID=101107 RepID=UPI00221F62CF|nr:uncharacterized protein BX664DRAFT_330963 [Halteromyces radiatus]KAI8093918.1 hypothetical protein BX664DRAFT_330963 [Halteromyces radiatus]
MDSISLPENSNNSNTKTNTGGPTTFNEQASLSINVPNNIIAIFLVRFHVHRGNELVWQYPFDVDLQGVEYQAICSGLHAVDKDIIYFSRQNGFGVGVFRKQVIEQDRGANMQAIGILTAPPAHGQPFELWQHISFLENQLELLDPTQVPPDPVYSTLKNYYDIHRQPVTISAPSTARLQQNYSMSVPMDIRFFRPFDSVSQAISFYIQSIPSTTAQKQFEQHSQDPSHSFSDMVVAFGPTLFVLWKSTLLKQRILLMSPSPPMEKLCHYVYNAYLMTHWQGPISSTTNKKKDIIPKFNIGINDIVTLETEQDSSYIACTSDTIFDIKKDLYDVLIKLPPSNTMTPNIPMTTISSIQVNAADLERYDLLKRLLPFSSSSQQPETTGSLSSLSSYRYQWALWWNSIDCSSILKHGIDPFSSCCRRNKSISNLQNQSWKYQHQRRKGGSIHTLDDTTSPLLQTSDVDDDQNNDNNDNDLLQGQDAEEIDTQVIMDTALQSSISFPSYRQSSNIMSSFTQSSTTSSLTTDPLNGTLIGFFHVLSYQLIYSLQTMIMTYDQVQQEENVDDETEQQQNGKPVVMISIQDMLRLGLDPWEDRGFINQLGQVYFGTQIKVSGWQDVYTKYLSMKNTCCCSQDSPGSLQL